MEVRHWVGCPGSAPAGSLLTGIKCSLRAPSSLLESVGRPAGRAVCAPGGCLEVLMQALGGEPWSPLSAGPGGEARPGAWLRQVPSVADVVKSGPVLHEL